LLIFRMRYDFVVYWHGGAFFFSSRRRHTRCYRDWSSDVCSSDLSTREGSAGWPLRTHTRASALAALVFILAAAARSPGGARGPLERVQVQKPESEFARLAARLAEQRLGGADEGQKLQEQALAILDGLALEALNAPQGLDLEALNKRLDAMATQQPPVGESYRVLRLGGQPAPYALVANFGLGGPSAV